MSPPSSPSSSTSPTRSRFWSPTYAQRPEDYTINHLQSYTFGSPGTGSVTGSGSSRSLSVSDGDGDGGESEWSAVDEEDSYRDPGPRIRTRGRPFRVADTTPRPSLVSRSHQSQPNPTKHPSSSHSSSGSPPLDDLNVNIPPQSSSTSPTASNSHSDEHHHPDELAHAFHNDDHRYDDDHSYDYDYDSSEEYSYTYSDDDGESPDVEISSAHYEPDVFIEGPAVNPRLIPSIGGSSGSRSTSIRRKGSSATESYWSGHSGYGSFTDRKGSIVSVWSYGAGSGAEGRQQRYHSSEELGLTSGDNTSASASGGTHPSSDEDWRRLLGPVQMANASPHAQPDPVLPDSPRFAVPSELDDGSVSASSRDATSDYDITYITQGFEQQPDFVSFASAGTGSTPISSPTFSSVSFLSTGSSSAVHSQSGSSVSGSGSASSGTHNRTQSRSAMNSLGLVGQGEKPLSLPPLLQQQIFQQRKRSLPGAYQNPWDLMQKTPFSKSPLGAAGKGKGKERPPSMMSAVSMNSVASSSNFAHDDSFARGLNAWGGQSYRDLRKEWVFRKDRLERSGSSNASMAAAGNSATGSRSGRATRQATPGMSVPSQENWSNYLLGRFLVIREEVGGETGGSGHTRIPSKSASKSRLKSSGTANASESRSGSSKKSAEKGPDNEKASLSSGKSSKDKGKGRDETVGEGLAETRSTGDISEPKTRLKSSKSKSSSQSQTSTLTSKSPKITEYANVNAKPPQQRLVIRKINGKARERASRQKTEAKAPSMTGSSAPQTIAESSTSSPPLSNESAFQSPAITVSPPESSLSEYEPSISVGASTSSQHPPSSSRDDSHSEISEQSRAPPSPNMLSHPLGYDPLHPAVVVHKHSKVAAFSFSRHHRSSWARGGTGYNSHVSPHARSKTVIMLAQRSVQEAFTTTETTKRFMETALLMNFDDSGVRKKREKEKDKALKEQATSGLGSGERDKRKDKEKGKEKRKDKDKEKEKEREREREREKEREREREKARKKASNHNLRLRIRSEGQVHLDEDGGVSPMKSSAKSKSRLPFPRSPTKTLGTKSAPAHVNEGEEDSAGDNHHESPIDHSIHRRASSSVLRGPGPSSSSSGVDTRSVPLPPAAAEEDEADPQRHLRSKQSRADDHYKAYGTLDRPNRDTAPPATRARRTSNSSLLKFKRLIPWTGTDTSKGSSTSEVTSSSSSNTLVGSTASFGSVTSSTVYVPPWMTLSTRDQQETQRKAEDAMGTLKMSFENVGLLPSVREAGERGKAKEREKKERTSLRRLGGKEKDKEKDRESDVLNCVPPESLFMLLPLWPGETDPYAHRYFPFDMPPVPQEERMFLLVYYKPLSHEMLAAMNINPRTTFSPIQDKRNILLPYFHIVARQVSYAELQGSGVRLPDQGLAVSGPLEEAFNTAPRLQSRPPSIAPSSSSSSSSSAQAPSSLGVPLRDCLMGSCYSRDAGIEFDPEALLELGLCSVLKEEDVIPNPLPPGRFEEEFERSITVKLTAVGSAVVEMAWAGGLALTSFSPVDESTKTKS